MLQHWRFECNSCLRWWFFSKYQIPQVLYVFGIVTENADRISPWQWPYSWSWSWVCPSIGLTPSVVCFWNCHRKCWWNKTLAMPISVAMAIAMDIFECLGALMKFYLGAKGLLRLGAVPNEVVHWIIWMWVLLGRLKVKIFFNAFLAKLGCFKAF